MRHNYTTISCLFLQIIIVLLFIEFAFAENESESIIPKDSVSEIQSENPDVSDLVNSVSDTSSDTGFSDRNAAELIPTDSGSADLDSSKTLDSDSAVINPADSSKESIEESIIDTSYRVWHSPFWSFGLGWSIGAMPVFNVWEEGLPYSIEEISVLSSFPDSLNLTLTLIEKPNTYNINFPIFVSFTPYIRNNRHISLTGSFFVMRKIYKAVVRDESRNTIWKSEQTLSLSSFLLGIRLIQPIPEKYFSVKKIEKVSFLIGISGSPLLVLNGESITVLNSKSTADNDFTAYGIGVSWELGISTLRKLSKKNGLEIGIYYLGSWNGRFMDNGHHINQGDLNPQNSKPSEIVQFTPQRIVIYFNILTGKKSKLAGNDDISNKSTNNKK